MQIFITVVRLLSASAVCADGVCVTCDVAKLVVEFLCESALPRTCAYVELRMAHPRTTESQKSGRYIVGICYVILSV